MAGEVRQGWPPIPIGVKALLVLTMLAALFVLQALIPGGDVSVSYLINRLFVVPLFAAALFFGLKGGLALAAVISFNTLYTSFPPSPATAVSSWDLGTQMGLYFAAGALIGILADRIRSDQQKLKETESLALLGQAAASAAHELKTPLVAIGGFAQRIFKDLEHDHPHREKLRIIVDQVDHMEHLLREMLDYSRPVELHLFPQPLNELVKEALTMCSVRAEDLGVQIVEELAPEHNFPLVDGARVKQVVMNLVENAMQASPCGATVHVLTRCDHDEIVLKVIDNGYGIPQDKQDKIFLPFFTTKSQGTGLGLAITHKIVEAHGGRLEMLSAAEKGATFCAHFPLCGPSQERYPHRSLVRRISK